LSFSLDTYKYKHLPRLLSTTIFFRSLLKKQL
jgi:hypothetical protein